MQELSDSKYAGTQFRVERLSLMAFRQLPFADIVFHPQFNYLIGGNGAGKTSILDALSYLLADLCGCPAEARYCAPTDPETAMKAGVYVKGRRVRWDLPHTPTPELTAAMPTDRRHEVRPVIAWYGTSRCSRDAFTFPKRKKTEIHGIPAYTKAYEGCLPFHKNKTTVNVLLRLLQELPSSAYPDVASAWGSVLRAVRTCVPECDDIRVMDTSTGVPEVAIRLKASGWFPLSRLGGGIRSLLVIALDLACRAAWLNPGELAVPATPGVALIEDLETCLHPLAQQTIVAKLQEAFPRIQFITTGHSPFILQSLKAGQAIDVTKLERWEEDPSCSSLEDATDREPEQQTMQAKEKLDEDADYEDDQTCEGYSCKEGYAFPGPTGGEYQDKSIEDITEDVMGVDLPQMSKRRLAMKEAAIEYYKLLEEGKNASEEKKKELKDKLNKLSEPFSDNVAYHAFLEMERIAAGFPPSKRKITGVDAED